MVLFLFVIMMFDLKKNQPESKSSLTKLAGSVVAGTLLVLLIALLRKNNLPAPSEVNFKSQTGMVETLGKILYTEYLLPFELISILFFVAMVGAVMLGKREAGERNF
jgi:NADH-quinone oxidoreductase subunit J